jgi:hypothetical protein
MLASCSEKQEPERTVGVMIVKRTRDFQTVTGRRVLVARQHAVKSRIKNVP